MFSTFVAKKQHLLLNFGRIPVWNQLFSEKTLQNFFFKYFSFFSLWIVKYGSSAFKRTRTRQKISKTRFSMALWNFVSLLVTAKKWSFWAKTLTFRPKKPWKVVFTVQFQNSRCSRVFNILSKSMLSKCGKFDYFTKISESFPKYSKTIWDINLGFPAPQKHFLIILAHIWWSRGTQKVLAVGSREWF